MTIRRWFPIVVAVLAAAGLSTHAWAQGAACTGLGKISKQIAKPMDAAKMAQKARKWNEVLARVKEAEAVPFTRTAWDQYWVHEYRAYAFHSLGQFAEAAREWEASVASPCQPEADKPQVYKRLAGLYFPLRNYPKSIDFANRGLAIQRDPELMVTLGQAYFQSGDNKNAVRVMKEVMNSFEQQGRIPKEQLLINVLNACNRMGDAACQTQLYEKLVQHYPEPEYWQNLLSALIAADSKDEVKLDVMRLAVAVDVMKQPEQFKEMAQIALDQGLPAEAESVIKHAQTAKLFKDKREIDLMDRLLKRAQADAVKDKAALPARETEAGAAPTGDPLVKLGASYLSYGQHEKAISALKRAVAKPQLTLSDEAGMLLGIAYRHLGKKTEAGQAFRSVKQDPTMARVAKLWLLNN